MARANKRLRELILHSGVRVNGSVKRFYGAIWWGANEQWFSNCAETRGVYGVFFEVVHRFPLNKSCSRARRIKRISWQTEGHDQGQFIQWKAAGVPT
tara:strand:+ start:1135 stop:1425 length:291 start_codon:yes stop_codon:yes gene_type:complete